MRIGDRRVGDGEPVYVIAEIGSNHDGQLDRAYNLVKMAAEAGADAAKFQLFQPDKLYPGQNTPGSIMRGWLEPLMGVCELYGVDFLCSVFDLKTLRWYQRLSPVAVKIASPEAANEELLYEAASFITPMLVSTGAMDDRMADRTNEVLAQADAEYALLHCVSAYPAEPVHMNLRAIDVMRREYRVPVGLSDHTLAVSSVPMLAVAAGASIIEKHLTYDRTAVGADHGFALEPDEFARMVEHVRAVEPVLGDGLKRVQPSEDATDRRAA